MVVGWYFFAGPSRNRGRFSDGGSIDGPKRREPGRRLSRHARRQHRDGRARDRVVAQDAEPRHPAPARAPHEPHGPRLRPSRSGQGARLRSRQGRRARADDRQPGMVAGRLGPLRRPDDPARLALGGLLPDRRRPRRRRLGQHPLRPAQLLARQREPRQGAPPALAGQEEVRQRAVLGGSDHPRRHNGLRVDGALDLRLRLRPRRHLGPRNRRLLGVGEAVARAVREPLRRSRDGLDARESAGRRPHGPDLRQSRRRERQPRSGPDRAPRTRDLRPDGHERRRDRGADLRRPHRGQGAWPRCRRPDRRGAGGGRHRGPGPGLGQSGPGRQGG